MRCDGRRKEDYAAARFAYFHPEPTCALTPHPHPSRRHPPSRRHHPLLPNSPAACAVPRTRSQRVGWHLPASSSTAACAPSSARWALEELHLRRGGPRGLAAKGWGFLKPPAAAHARACSLAYVLSGGAAPAAADSTDDALLRARCPHRSPHARGHSPRLLRGGRHPRLIAPTASSTAFPRDCASSSEPSTVLGPSAPY